MFTVNNKDTRTTPLTQLILNIVNIDILNIEQLLHLILAGTNDITKTLKIKYFLCFNFAITKICVAIRLAEDGKGMAAYSFDYPQVFNESPDNRLKQWINDNAGSSHREEFR